MAFTKITNAGFGLTTGTLVGVAASFSSTVSVGGTLTYEDVTNVDSVGLITARNGIEVTDKGVQVGTGATVDSAAANTLTFLTGGSERLRINSDGLVTVGGNETVSAATGIQIENAGAALLTLLRNDATISDGNTLGGIDFYGNDGGTVQQVAKISAVADGTHGNNDKPTRLIFSTTADGGSSATERLRIGNAGHVGIKNTVAATIDAVNNAGTLVVGDGSSAEGITIYTSDSTSGELAFADATSGSGTQRGRIIYAHGDNSMRISTNGAEVVRIASDGDIGVGLASPNSRLHVKGGSESTDNLLLTLQSDGVANDGSLSTGLRLINSTSDSSIHGGEIRAIRTSSSAADLTFSTYNGSSIAEALRITSAGLVGIGTDTPGTALEVSASGAVANVKAEGQTNARVRIEAGNTSSSYLEFGDSDDSDVGEIVYDHSDNSMRFRTNGSPHVYIKSDGNVRIGSTAGGTQPLCIAGSDSSGVNLQFQNSTTGNNSNDGVLIGLSGGEDGQFWNYENNNLLFGTNNIERMRIGSSGVSIGHPGTPDSLLTIGGNAITTVKPTVCVFPSSGSGSVTIRGGEPTLCFDQTGGNNQRIIYDDSTDLIFQNGTLDSITERVRFFDTGQTHHFSSTNCFVTATSQGAGTTTWLIRGIRSRTTNTSGGSTVFYVYSNGNVQNTNNSYGAISDVKLKENIVDATSQWEDLKALQIRKYNFIEGETHTQLGVIAQEVETVSPGLVNDIADRDEEGNDLGTVTKTVNYSVLYMKAVKALQEAMDRIETLEAKVAALEG